MSKEQIKVENGYIMYEEEREEVNREDYENRNLFIFNEKGSIQLEDVFIPCFTNGFTDLYAYKELVNYLPKEEQKERNARQRLLYNVDNQYIYEDVLVSYRNDRMKLTLVSEDGLYHIILNTNHPRTHQIKLKLLASIRRFRVQSGWTVTQFLSDYGLGADTWVHEFDDSDIRNKFKDSIYNDVNLKEEDIAFTNINTFPLLNENIVTNEFTTDYIESLDKVKLCNKVDFMLGAERTSYILSGLLGVSEPTLLDEFIKRELHPMNIFKHTYFYPSDIYDILIYSDLKVENPKEIMQEFLSKFVNNKEFGLVLFESIDKFADVNYIVPFEVFTYYTNKVREIVMNGNTDMNEATKLAKTFTWAYYKYNDLLDY